MMRSVPQSRRLLPEWMYRIWERGFLKRCTLVFWCGMGIALILSFSDGLIVSSLAEEVFSSQLKWQSLPPLPENGFAGMYAGTSGSVLIAAGGTNFPNGKDGQRGPKNWCKNVYFLDPEVGYWQTADVTLPGPTAYGASVSYGNEVICIGGADETLHYSDVFSLRYDRESVVVRSLAALPFPTAYHCAEIVDGILYVAAGLETPTSCEAKHAFWSLDLKMPDDQRRWHEREVWPGKPRHRAVAGAGANAFYLFSGIESSCNENGGIDWKIPYLRDGYRYVSAADRTTGRWKQISELPIATAAAPSPAIAVDESHLALLGGLEGKEQYPIPGFSRRVQVYNTTTNTWTTQLEMPGNTSCVTAPTAHWRSGAIVFGGESAPGERSSQVQYIYSSPRRSTANTTR